MASFTLKREDVFPVGTTVTAYPLANWPQSQRPPTGAPVGSSSASAVVGAGGTVTLTGLADSTNYVAYAASPDRYIRFATPAAAAATGDIANAGAMVVPVVSNVPANVSAVTTVLRLYLFRCIVPRTGTLRDVAVFAGATQAGNHMGAVYDVGEATAGSVTKLWDSGSVTALTVNTWAVLGDPNLAVTAGQNIQLGFITDSATQTFGRITAGSSPNPWQSLPNNFMAQGNGLAIKPLSGATQGALSCPATITDANLTAPGTANVPFVIARVA